MKMNGEEIIEAPIETVWKALNDPNILKQCIPGCESITMTSPTEMKARVTVKLGPVKAGFNGVVHLKDCIRPKAIGSRARARVVSPAMRRVAPPSISRPCLRARA